LKIKSGFLPDVQLNVFAGIGSETGLRYFDGVSIGTQIRKSIITFFAGRRFGLNVSRLINHDDSRSSDDRALRIGYLSGDGRRIDLRRS
jgi:hypothetical protein